MKSGENDQAVLEKKTFKDYIILYMYIAKRHEQITPPGDKILIVTKVLLLLIIYWKFQQGENCQAISEKVSNDYTILYMYIAQGKEQIPC